MKLEGYKKIDNNLDMDDTMEKSMKNRIPTVEEAELILERAAKINPGFWIGHSRNVAQSAKILAVNCDGLDPEVAYVLGLLHDIGNTFDF